MCTWIMNSADLQGSGKGTAGWFRIHQANVAYDHPSSDVKLDHAILIDFVNEAMGPAARVAIELSPESARELVQAIMATLEEGVAQNVIDIDLPANGQATLLHSHA